MRSHRFPSNGAHPATVELDQLESHVLCRLGGRVRDLRLLLRHNGLVLQGRVSTYYAKQLVQQAVLDAAPLPIVANEIQVS